MRKRDLKKCKIILAILLLCTQLFAHSGLLGNEKKLRVAKTEWFDIIYPARCQESAAILYEKADGVYEEVTGQYGLTPAFRMPVVITPAVDSFNAFWAAVPYNHIAIYDTGLSGNSDLAVFSETLLSTFRHELTHAVTYNMKNGFWRVAGKVMGDCVAPGMLSVTTGMAEGATVTSESAAGEGRLNNEYSKHYVKQAKIEDKFPAYHDVSGAADIQPGGAPYYFNGAFHGWLQEKYGMEAYAEFWYRVVNGKNFTISGAFKKSFGIKLKKAWKKFVEEYEVPDEVLEVPNPVSAGLVQDFFEPGEDDYSNLNDAGSIYTSLTSAVTDSGKERLVWIDRYGGRVFVSESFKESPVFRHLFSHLNMTNVRLSNDGRFLTVNYISGNAPTDTARVKIYDFDRGSFYLLPEKGLKEAVVVKDDGGWYLVAQKYFAQHYSIALYRLLMSDGSRRIRGIENVAEIVLDVETDPYEFTALKDGTFAWLKKERMNYSLCISNAEGDLLSEFAFPEGLCPHSLSYGSDETFYLSYVEDGTLPRLGKVELDEEGAELYLSDSDISGGVFAPVLWKDRIVYTGEFLRQNRLLIMEDSCEWDSSLSEASRAGLSAADELSPAGSASLSNPAGEGDLPSLSIPSKAYNPFPYIFRGLLIPIGTYESDYFGENTKSDSLFDNFYPGLTYLTANPWTDGGSELYSLTGGWNPVSQTFGTALSITEGTATSLFSSQTQLKSEFDKRGWKQGGAILTLSSSISTGRISSISLSNTASALLGNQKELYLSLSDIVSAQFSTLRRYGPGRFENAGFAVTASYGKWYDTELTGSAKQYTDSSALAAATRICIPHLLPFESKYGYTYNLPLSLTAKLLPSSSIYGYVTFGPEETKDESKDSSKKSSQKKPVDYKAMAGRPVFDATVEVTAFSMDIQKAIPFMTAIYLNDFSVNLGYAATGTAGSASETGFQTAKLGEYFKAMTDGRGYYLDSVFAKVTLEFTPNIGTFARPNFKMGVYAIYSYTLRSVRELKASERTALSIGLNLNF